MDVAQAARSNSRGTSNTAATAVLIVDEDLRIVYADPGFFPGLCDADLDQTKFRLSDCLAPDGIIAIKRWMVSESASGAELKLELRLPDSDPLPVIARIVSIQGRLALVVRRAAGGNRASEELATALPNSVDGPTETRRAAATLTPSCHDLVGEIFQKAFEFAPYPKLLVDQFGVVLMANQAALEFFGLDRKALVGESVNLLIPPRFRERHGKLLRDYFRNPRPRRLVEGLPLKARLSSGEECDVSIGLSPIAYHGQHLILVLIQDLRVIQAAAKALSDSQERFRLVVEGTDTGVWDWDLRDNSVYFSPRWKAQLGFADNELSNSFDEWETRIHPHDRAEALVTLQRYLSGEIQDFQLEHRLRHRNGSYRSILARGAGLRDADGRIMRMVGSHLDITEWKDAQVAVERGRAERTAAQQLQRSLLQADPTDIGWLDIASRCEPAEFAGGDFYQYLGADGKALRIVLGDVSGHGFPAALLMATIHTFLGSLSWQCATLEELLYRLSRFAGHKCQDGKFVTLIMLEIDVEERTVQASNAGHVPFGYVLNESGEVTRTIEPGSCPLGLIAPVRPRFADPHPLRAGEIIVLLSDGLTESRTSNDELFGVTQVLEIVRRHRQESARSICDAIFSAVHAHCEPIDDTTAVIIKVTEGT